MARLKNDGAGDLVLRIAGKAVTIGPGDEVTVDDNAFDKIRGTPVVAAWIESGRLAVSAKRVAPAGKGGKPSSTDGDGEK